MHTYLMISIALCMVAILFAPSHEKHPPWVNLGVKLIAANFLGALFAFLCYYFWGFH